MSATWGQRFAAWWAGLGYTALFEPWRLWEERVAAARADLLAELEVARKLNRGLQSELTERERELDAANHVIQAYLRSHVKIDILTGPRRYATRTFGFQIDMDEHMLMSTFGAVGKDDLCRYIVEMFGHKLADELARCIAAPSIKETYERRSVNLYDAREEPGR